jgi:hypothetical protein
MVAIGVVLVASFIATLSIRRSADEIRFEFATAWSAAVSLGLSIALVTSLQLGLLAVLASGAAGPGRLSLIGINPWLLMLISFIEVFAVATLAAFLSARPTDTSDTKPRAVN